MFHIQSRLIAKAISSLLLAFGFIAEALGQGTVQFNVDLKTVPPFESTVEMQYSGKGEFELTGSVLSGTLLYTPLDRQSFNRIETQAGLPFQSPPPVVSCFSPRY
jgi:hypothetical protein